MRVGAVVRASVIAVALPAVLGTACGGGDGTGVVRVTALEFATVPGAVTAGVAFTVTVELLRSNGEVASSATDEVTLTLLNPGAAVLNGTTTVAAVDGIATFSGLTINQAGTGRQFHAATVEFSTQSATFAVGRGPVSASESAVTPAPGNIPPDGEASLTFTFKDAFGNAVSNSPVSFSTNLPGAVLDPPSGSTTAAGTFVTSLTMPSTGSATVAAVVDGVPVVGSAPDVVVPDLCPIPAAMAFPGTVNGTQPCGNYIATAYSPAFYSFTSTGGGAQFTVTSTYSTRLTITPSLFDLRIAAVLGPPTGTVEWLLPAGDFIAVMQPQDGGAGPFTLASATGPGNTGAVERLLAASGTYTGQSLANSDNFDDRGGAWYVDYYHFFSLGPCTITMQAPSFAAYLQVSFTSTPGGAEAVEAAPGQDAVINLAVCHGGRPVEIYVSSVDNLVTGAYTLILDAPATGGAVASLRAALSPQHVGDIPLPAFTQSVFVPQRTQVRAPRRR